MEWFYYISFFKYTCLWANHIRVVNYSFKVLKMVLIPIETLRYIYKYHCFRKMSQWIFMLHPWNPHLEQQSHFGNESNCFLFYPTISKATSSKLEHLCTRNSEGKKYTNVWFSFDKSISLYQAHDADECKGMHPYKQECMQQIRDSTLPGISIINFTMREMICERLR